MNFKKALLVAGLIAASAINAGCTSKPTLDRAVLNGYKECVAADARAQGEIKAANARGRGEALASGKYYAETLHFPRNCKAEFGISQLRQITDYRIIN